MVVRPDQAVLARRQAQQQQPHRPGLGQHEATLHLGLGQRLALSLAQGCGVDDFKRQRQAAADRLHRLAQHTAQIGRAQATMARHHELPGLAKGRHIELAVELESVLVDIGRLVAREHPVHEHRLLRWRQRVHGLIGRVRGKKGLGLGGAERRDGREGRCCQCGRCRRGEWLRHSSEPRHAGMRQHIGRAQRQPGHTRAHDDAQRVQ